MRLARPKAPVPMRHSTSPRMSLHQFLRALTCRLPRISGPFGRVIAAAFDCAGSAYQVSICRGLVRSRMSQLQNATPSDQTGELLARSRRKCMNDKGSMGAIALVAAMVIVGIGGANAHDEKKYPDLSGQWKRPPGIANQFDVSKPQRL